MIFSLFIVALLFAAFFVRSSRAKILPYFNLALKLQNRNQLNNRIKVSIIYTRRWNKNIVVDLQEFSSAIYQVGQTRQVINVCSTTSKSQSTSRSCHTNVLRQMVVSISNRHAGSTVTDKSRVIHQKNVKFVRV